VGFDVHPWAVSEAAWTYRFLDLHGSAHRGNVAKTRIEAGSAVIAAYTLNELDAPSRNRILTTARTSGGPLLVVEPIARAVTPWWDGAAREVIAHGGRADDWKLPLEMPERWLLLDRAAGFRRVHLSARSLWLPAR
jgi:hypothetical protein